MKNNIDVGDYHWSKMRYFKKGNIILVRDSKNGIDYLIQLLIDGRLMTDEELAFADYNTSYLLGHFVLKSKEYKGGFYASRSQRAVACMV